MKARKFPLRANAKIPLTRNGFKDASSDPVQIAKWEREHPGCNLGMATGATSGLVVLDLDVKNTDADGLKWWEEQLEVHGKIETCEVVTPSNGLHLYFLQPAGILLKSSAGVMAPGVDTRAEGGYVVIPPSVIDGNPYLVVNRCTAIAPIPAWLLDIWPRVGSAPPQRGSAFHHSVNHNRSSSGSPGYLTAPIPEGQRNDTLTRICGYWHARLPDDSLVRHLVYQANQTQCSPTLSQWELEAILDSILRRDGAGQFRGVRPAVLTQVQR